MYFCLFFSMQKFTEQKVWWREGKPSLPARPPPQTLPFFHSFFVPSFSHFFSYTSIYIYIFSLKSFHNFYLSFMLICHLKKKKFFVVVVVKTRLQTSLYGWRNCMLPVLFFFHPCFLFSLPLSHFHTLSLISFTLSFTLSFTPSLPSFLSLLSESLKMESGGSVLM